MKKNIIPLFFALVLCIASLSFGVYAFFSLALTANGSISFDSLKADIDLDISVIGAKNSVNKFQGTTNSERQPGRQLISDFTWNYTNLEFSTSKSITFEIKVNNFSRFAIESSITLPANNELNMEKQESNFSYAFDSSLGADAKNLFIKISPVNSQFASAFNFQFSMNINKTLNKESESSKFIWGTPSGGNISITGNSFSDSDVNIIIPRKYGNYIVTEIGYSAFDSKKINSVYIPETITSISNYAFSSCTLLTKINIPESVKFIGFRAFYNCSSLTTFKIPKSVTVLGSEVFSRCTKLVKIEVDSNNTSFSSDNNVLYDKNKTTLIYYPPNGPTSFTVPNTVKTIGSSAFYESNISQITLPDGVTTIDSSAFSYSKISDITIPDSVTSIGGSAFNGCSYLSQIILPSDLTIIYYSTFNGCSSLKSVKLPKEITVIEEYAFYNCISLKEINFPYTLTEIKEYAFSECTSLESISIPSNVTNIADNSFLLCSKITSVYIETLDEMHSLYVGYNTFYGIARYSTIYVKSEYIKMKLIGGVSFDSANTEIIIEEPVVYDEVLYNEKAFIEEFVFYVPYWIIDNDYYYIIDYGQAMNLDRGFIDIFIDFFDRVYGRYSQMQADEFGAALLNLYNFVESENPDSVSFCNLNTSAKQVFFNMYQELFNILNISVTFNREPFNSRFTCTFYDNEDYVTILTYEGLPFFFSLPY